MAQEPITAYIGTGLSFPIKLENGKPVLSSLETHIEASIRNIIIWNFGSGYFVKDFGSRLYELLEEPIISTIRFMSKEFIKEAITNWEPRVKDVEVTSQISGPASVDITIEYKIRLNNTVQRISQNLIFS